ncbi:MAG: putative porin [Acidobacteria bacterium]|nr:putative porin [Acidobacteriota bacterium]
MRRTVGVISLGMLLLPAAAAAADSWTDKVKLKGDFRYRHETIKVEDRDARNRHRMRARFGIEAKPNDNVTLGLQLASGSDDPVSTNESLDGGFSTKDIRLDLAYFDLGFKQAPGLRLTGGKIKNPYYVPGGTELIWDGDLNPEGGALKYSGKSGSVKLFTNIGGFWVEERSSDVDTWLFGAQGGIELAFPDKKGSFTAGATYYNYENARGKSPIFDSGDPFGNSVDEAGRYLYDYDLVELFGEMKINAGSLPVAVFVDYVKNVAEGEIAGNEGWLVGGKVGKLKDPGSVEFRYNYRNIEKDAVLGIFTDSDFIGGGTDGKGSEFGLDVQLAKNFSAGASYFLNKLGTASGADDFHRLQLDLVFKF